MFSFPSLSLDCRRLVPAEFLKKFGLILGFTSGAIIVSGLSTNLNIGQLQDLLRRQAQTEAAILAAEQVLGDLKDIETGARGYALAGEDRFLLPYEVASKQLAGRINTLDGLVRSSQQSRIDDLRRLAYQRLQASTALIEARRAGGIEAAVKEVRTDRGRLLMDQIREETEVIKRQEAMALEIRRDAVLISARAATYSSVVTVLLALLLIVLAYRIAREEIERRKAAERKLEQSIEAKEFQMLNVSGRLEHYIADFQNRKESIRDLQEALEEMKRSN